MLSKKTLSLCFWVSLARAAAPSAASVGSDLWLLFQNDLDCKRHTVHQRFPLIYNTHRAYDGRASQLYPPQRTYSYRRYLCLCPAQRRPGTYQRHLLSLRHCTNSRICLFGNWRFPNSKVLDRRLDFSKQFIMSLCQHLRP